jgi:hypothetical protein
MRNIAENRGSLRVDSLIITVKPCDFTWKYRSVIAKGRQRNRRPGERLTTKRLVINTAGRERCPRLSDTRRTCSSVEIVIDQETGKKSPNPPRKPF